MKQSMLAATAAIALVASATLPSHASASVATNVTIRSVQQRWPWNNKVDITYAVEGGQTRTAGVYCGLRFEVEANGQTYEFEGYTVGASAEDGEHTITWTAPEGIVCSDCTLTATLFSTNVASGDDYLVVDLATGKVAYEGLLSSQDASNERYNVADYKTDKLVLRKVPRWADRASLPNAASLPSAGYPTGDDVSVSDNGTKKWTTERDYYIGVFPVTQKQYQKIYGSNPSTKTTTISGNVTAHRPVETVSWNDLRVSTTASTSSIPAVASFTGTFFQRLNFRTGLDFDLPTEVMFEIAERAGSTTKWAWGNSMVTNYCVCSENSGGSTVAVGSRLPNNWGLFDTIGNVYEWVRDVWNSSNLRNRVDAFTPYAGTDANRRNRGGGAFSYGKDGIYFRASHRGDKNAASARTSVIGFRVALITEK